jgi:hypothetical protein
MGSGVEIVVHIGGCGRVEHHGVSRGKPASRQSIKYTQQAKGTALVNAAVNYMLGWTDLGKPISVTPLASATGEEGTALPRFRLSMIYLRAGDQIFGSGPN